MLYEVITDITLVDLDRTDQISRAFDQLAFVFEVAVVTLHKRIFPKDIGTMLSGRCGGQTRNNFV